MLKKLIGNKARKPLIISLVFVLITLCILFYLTFQPPADTVALSEKVGHLPVVEDFLNWVGAFVDWSVRQWAHVFEFLIIGICVSIFLCICSEENPADAGIGIINLYVYIIVRSVSSDIHCRKTF